MAQEASPICEAASAASLSVSPSTSSGLLFLPAKSLSVFQSFQGTFLFAHQ
jgi:hypothetical protein